MFDAICALPLTSDLFTQATHPSQPIVATGLAAGHVQTFRLPEIEEGDNGSGAEAEADSGCGEMATAWRTRRHKGSCRCLAFSADGEALISGGTDGILKAASTATGQVTSKIAVPTDRTFSSTDSPALIHALSPQCLLLATDSSALHFYDLRDRTSSFVSNKPQQTHHPHADYISSLSPLPPTDATTSGYSKQWVTTGGTTLAVTDLRRGVLVQSEDQEEELLSSVYVSGLRSKGGRSGGEKLLVGSASGVITLWEKGQWDDQQSRIVVDRGVGGGESLDTLALLPDSLSSVRGKHVAVGTGEGKVKLVKLGANQVVGEITHDEVEGVVGLCVDVGGRLISGGGQILKVWREAIEQKDEEEDVNGAESDESGGEDSEASSDSDESSDDELERRKRRKREKTQSGRGRNAKTPRYDFRGLV
ncbi:MAG: WD repeat-containing protein jip5 [Piccolia ochrophora]|nr:MAG: WD repeat-containing protein jip5 [Piccolia ochrophora]